MDIKDRGSKKWTSLMLPEHVKMLQELNVDYERVKKPTIDEQGWEQINETLHIAIEYNLPVAFTLWQDGFFNDVEGKVHYIDLVNELVHVVDINLRAHRIDFDAIASVEFAN